MILNIYKYRKYIIKTAWDDMRYRYAGTGMGVFWNILIPLAQILIYSIVFSRLMNLKFPNVPSTYAFALYLCSGFLPWNTFVECIIRGTNSFVENANYLKKMPIPEQVFVAKGAMSATYGLLISLGLLFILAIAMGHRPSLLWLYMPCIALLFQGFGFGIGLLLSSINVFFRDVGQAVNILLQIWFWTVPIVYPESILPDAMQQSLVLNPVYPFILAIRDVFLFEKLPELWTFRVMLLWVMLANLFGYLVLRRLRPELRDVL